MEKQILPKKKILIVTFPHGGPFVWAQNLGKHLEKNGYQVKISTGRKNYFLDQFRRYDIVHSCVALPFSLAKKFILTIHGNYKEENHRSKYFFPIAISHADSVTVPSLFLKKALDLEKAMVISNGVDLPEITKNNYALHLENPKLGILTSFDFRKKADGTLKLAEIIRTVDPQAKLVIGGSGKFLEEYKNKLLSIHKNIEFLGHCKKEDLFNQIDIFTYYSMLDNQPIAVLEAMAYGLPVMSNEVGAIREVMAGKLERYIAQGEGDYENLLKKLLNSQEAREENGQEAKTISQDFSWNKIVEDWIRLYNE